MMLPDDLMTTPATARYLAAAHGIRVTPGALRTRRCLGLDGPEFLRVGHSVFYSRAAIDEYARRAISGPSLPAKEVAAPVRRPMTESELAALVRSIEDGIVALNTWVDEMRSERLAADRRAIMSIHVGDAP